MWSCASHLHESRSSFPETSSSAIVPWSNQSLALGSLFLAMVLHEGVVDIAGGLIGTIHRGKLTIHAVEGRHDAFIRHPVSNCEPFPSSLANHQG